MSGRVVAVVVLLILWPGMLIIGLLIAFLGGGPVVLMKTIALRGGATRQILRFRSTGTGARGFRALGTWMQRCRVDDYPALWSVIRGDITLSDAWRYWRRETE